MKADDTALTRNRRNFIPSKKMYGLSDLPVQNSSGLLAGSSRSVLSIKFYGQKKIQYGATFGQSKMSN